MTTRNVSCPVRFGARRVSVMKIAIIITASVLLLLTVLYTTLYILHNSKMTTNITFPTPEKLVSIEKQVIEPLSARPFINDLRGDSPSGFSQFSYSTTTPPPPIFPENHRYPDRPNNIHDIIEYLTENAHRQKELIKHDQRYKLNKIRNSQQFSQDPFFAFKPQDPSDINLLAPNNFRFAPAIVPKNKQAIKAEESATRNASLAFIKPLKVTLNIYPSPFLLGGLEREFASFQGPGITPRYRYQLDRNVVTPGRMVVHLNLYPKLTDYNRQLFKQQLYQN